LPPQHAGWHPWPASLQARRLQRDDHTELEEFQMIGTIAAIAALSVSAVVILAVVMGAIAGGSSRAKKVGVAVLGVSVIAGALGFFIWDQQRINAVHQQIAALRHN
jgi:hypothetical protein